MIDLSYTFNGLFAHFLPHTKQGEAAWIELFEANQKNASVNFLDLPFAPGRHVKIERRAITDCGPAGKAIRPNERHGLIHREALVNPHG